MNGGFFMSTRRTQAIALTLLLLSTIGLWASEDAQPDTKPVEEQQSAKANEIADRIFYREAKFVQDLRPYTPMVETYIQNFKGDAELGQVPSSDKYFIGRLILKKGIEDVSFQ